jgi:hypothetical protein
MIKRTSLIFPHSIPEDVLITFSLQRLQIKEIIVQLIIVNFYHFLHLKLFLTGKVPERNFFSTFDFLVEMRVKNIYGAGEGLYLTENGI